MTAPDLAEAMTRSADVRAERAARDGADPEVQRHLRNIVPVTSPRGWELRQAGPDGACFDKPRTGRRVILSVSREGDDAIWLHASISRRDRGLPTYDDLVEMHRTFFGHLVAMQLFVPQQEHVNLNEVLHLFACLDARVTPDFTGGTGSI